MVSSQRRLTSLSGCTEPKKNYTGEPIVEPEVDLSAFLEKQTISGETGPTMRVAETKDYDEDDVDTSLAHISSNHSRISAQGTSKKGKVEEIAWDETLDAMTREKQAAEATWGQHTYQDFISAYLTLFLLQTSRVGSEQNLRNYAQNR